LAAAYAAQSANLLNARLSNRAEVNAVHQANLDISGEIAQIGWENAAASYVLGKVERALMPSIQDQLARDSLNIAAPKLAKLEYNNYRRREHN